MAAHKAALEERTRECVPLDWAASQHNLGAALQTLGERESGTGRLEEAVAAFKAALEERTREHVPLDWAHSKLRLAAALEVLAMRTKNATLMEQAIESAQSAAEVYRAGAVNYLLTVADICLARMKAAIAEMQGVSRLE